MIFYHDIKTGNMILDYSINQKNKVGLYTKDPAKMLLKDISALKPY